MIRKLFKKLFQGPKQESKEIYIIAQLNDKIMPISRGEVYEDPLDEFLKSNSYGEVTGGGTQLMEDNDIAYCDLEIRLFNHPTKHIIDEIINKLEYLGAPKGSKMIVEYTGEQIPFGKLEGLGLYLDGINLSDEVYKNSDSEALAEEIRRLANIKSDVVRYWNGNTETGLYFYGDSFEGIKNSISDFLSTTPDCEGCRIVQVA
ncbi:hypothetical protein [Pedobacter nyackensis]|uniref:Uncharacterized protein n=1 Tax=Pedobacter nyackensis TaxID=475255 RepID=A0A1W2AJG3_9SPHI|nr:hypothetical protein [Pedobacter nyackensis]SMC60700.1 hypothetical protein SAMN04488101_101659 [Pedobacter nyackensis]